MNYITKETKVNLFGKPKRFLDVMSTQPIVAEMFFNRMSDCIMDTETLRIVCWMFPESTNRVVDRIILENQRRIDDRNERLKRIAENRRRYMTAMNDGRINYCEQNDGRVVIRKSTRIVRPIDKLNELFK
jgi:hypothetical protein